MIRTLLVGTLVVSGLWLLGVAKPQVARGEDISAALLERASCASATCHGGVNASIDWRSSALRYAAVDPHARAGSLLLDPDSIAIATRLLASDPSVPAEVVSGEKDPLITRSSEDERVQMVLIERCAGCHAPILAGGGTSTSMARPIEVGFQLSIGCRDCHGDSKQWLAAHTERQWYDRGGERFVGTGLRNTQSLGVVASLCSDCHVGSRRDGESVRDVNHDLIAAGHPPLRFELNAFLTALPAHWPTDREAAWGSHRQRLLVGQLDGLSKSVELDRSRCEAGPGVAPWPEFANYDCFACHHELHQPRTRGFPSHRAGLGVPRWQPWFTQGPADLTRIADPFPFPINRRLFLKASESIGADLQKEIERSISDANLVEQLTSAAVSESIDRQAAPSAAVDGSNAKKSRAAPLDWYWVARRYLTLHAIQQDQPSDPLVAQMQVLEPLVEVIPHRSADGTETIASPAGLLRNPQYRKSSSNSRPSSVDVDATLEQTQR
jgi:hypothetical protein